MLNHFFAQVATQTPVTDELLDKAERVIGIWDTLTPVMAILFFAVLALIVILAVVWFNRNNSSAAIEAQNKLFDRQEKDIAELKTEIRDERSKYFETFKVIGDQLTRGNDLWEAINTQTGQRVSQQQRLVESQAQIAVDLKNIATVGSPTVQAIQIKVSEIKDIVTHIDKRTADWPGILETITPLLTELGVLRQEAKKHSTQPIPAIDVPASGEITIEGTVKGTVVQENPQ